MKNKQEEWLVVSSILIIFISVIGIYTYNFYAYEWSEHPEDWGTIGDYLGGILNPIISLLALVYLVKAYRSQKQELAETKNVLEQTERHNEKLADAQVSLANTIESQLSISIDSHAAKLISYKIESRSNYLSFLQKELERVSTALGNKHVFYDLDSNERDSHGEGHEYRITMIRKVKAVSSEIIELEKKLDNLLDKNT
ncbi:hypothetical protein C4G56_RS23480 [Vibrio parahaemolyticus]|nr:hypothetical protein [Vibrio parahaemolyticus]EHU4959558.1 hypothetical protein [Vibrio parahaemolyticus]EJG0655356.1 hypothetical protein [Vibrio parahaemolyticus]EJG0772327.1 hypothetical protein [Vibrio parahaemolyticus]EJG0805218.1 hypothetical protein [Vibrio parahaemolyticus]